MLAMKSSKVKIDKGKQVYHIGYPFRQVGDGLKKCMECGMIVASGEKYSHGAYHKRYIDMFNKYERMVTEYVMEKYRKELCGVSSLTEEQLCKLEIMEFNTSLRSGDYGSVHPTYKEYMILLWNTKEFKEEIRELIGEDIYETRVSKYSSNRCLRVFGDYSYISLIKCEGEADVSHLDKYGLREEILEEEEERGAAVIKHKVEERDLGELQSVAVGESPKKEKKVIRVVQE